MSERQPLDYFYEITKIPRRSGDEEGITQYLIDFAKHHNLQHVVYDDNNLIIKKQGQGVSQSHAPVILQAHTDMVYIAENDSVHDYHSPLPVIEQEGFITSSGTSLGADNGIGMAYILSVLDSRELNHPPIEALFTSCEEDGLKGATHLEWKDLTGQRLINLDAEEEGTLIVGCAGGANYKMHLPVRQDCISRPQRNRSYVIKLQGMRGGHSGLEIDQNRSNAIILLTQVLNLLSKEVPVFLSEFSGGTFPNVIPNSASVRFTCDIMQTGLLEETFARISKTVISEILDSEPTASISLATCSPCDTHISLSRTKEIISALCLVPNGVIEVNNNLDNQVQTSSNLGLINTSNDGLEIIGNIRSSSETTIADITEKVRLLTQLVHGKCSFDSFYPGWQSSLDSELTHLCKETFAAKYPGTMKLASIHAGLECGCFSKKNPELEMVSLGPNIIDAHSVDERVEIESVNSVWEYLEQLLGKL